MGAEERVPARAASGYVSINVYRTTGGELMIAGLVRSPGGKNVRLVRSVGLWHAPDDVRTPEDIMRAFLTAVVPGARPLER